MLVGSANNNLQVSSLRLSTERFTQRTVQRALLVCSFLCSFEFAKLNFLSQMAF